LQSYWSWNLTGGSIKITSNNPFDAPAIDPNMLSTDFDIFAMVDAVKNIKRFVYAPAFESLVEGPFGAFAQAQTDAQLEAYVRADTTTIFHPTGTASMTKSSSNNGVVNPDLTVKGADGLRIVDASVFVSGITCSKR
jgi:choline dehydrogenase-like flavoprotein